MGIWHTKLGEQADEGRAERIILKKRRKQDPAATGLAAVAIARTGSRAAHLRSDDRNALREKPVQAVYRGEHCEVSLLDMSANGIMIAGAMPAGRGDEITLTIGDAPPIAAFIRWMRDERIGLELCGHTEIAAAPETCEALLSAVLPTPLADKPDQAEKSTWAIPRRESGRPELVWIGKLSCEGRSVTARLRTISESGAVVSLAAPLGVTDGAKVVLKLPCARVTCKVDWCAAQELHLRFDKPFDISALVDEPCAEIAARMPPGVGDLSDHDDQADADRLTITALRIGDWQALSADRQPSVSLEELHDLLAGGPQPSGS